ncbi:MAG TPA: hemolysin III family protein [Longimicrobiaceae bacterium]|jgi:hemolysin III|nr:hemolysin III family protein [Longimicrobiaceae bacterium]
MDGSTRPTWAEEVANSVTHGAGLLASAVALPVLVALAAMHGTVWHVVAASVFGGSLVALYGASTIYHAVRSPRAKHVMRIADHSAIYLLIAGTYTPFTLVTLRGPWGWSLFGVVWGLAAAGIAFKLFFVDRFIGLSTAMYVAMGWLVVVAAKPMLALVPAGGLGWMAAGGLAYTGGVVFFLWHRLRYSHAVWHLFVLAGSACHFVAILRYVILPA